MHPRKRPCRSLHIISLVSGRCGCNLELIIFKLISRIDILHISYEIALRWMPQHLIDDWSTLVQVMVWCHQTKAITSVNVAPDLCRYMVSLNHSGLKLFWVFLSKNISGYQMPATTCFAIRSSNIVIILQGLHFLVGLMSFNRNPRKGFCFLKCWVCLCMYW